MNKYSILMTIPKCMILVGAPASTKTTYAKALSGYERISRDDLGTMKKCQEAFAVAINLRKNIVLDNTNPSAGNRKYFIDLARLNNYYIKCLVFDVPINIAKKLNQNRIDKKPVPNIVYNVFSKNFELPLVTEGIDEIGIMKIVKIE